MSSENIPPEPTVPGNDGPLDAVNHLVCLRCGHDDIAVDYLAAVSVSICAGLPVSVVSAGVIDGLPEALYCHRCGEDERIDPADDRSAVFLAALEDMVGRALPAPVLETLATGMTVWQTPGTGH